MWGVRFMELLIPDFQLVSAVVTTLHTHIASPYRLVIEIKIMHCRVINMPCLRSKDSETVQSLKVEARQSSITSQPIHLVPQQLLMGPVHLPSHPRDTKKKFQNIPYLSTSPRENYPIITMTITSQNTITFFLLIMTAIINLFLASSSWNNLTSSRYIGNLLP